MNCFQLIFAISTFFSYSFPLILAQQPYIGMATTLCDSRDNSTSVLGYTCNGVSRSCQAYLTFRAEPPYNSVSTISTLLAVDPSQLSQINSVPENTIFKLNQMVLVPVTCSCAGQYYQANTSYTIRGGDTYLWIANNTFQGLSTCQALQVQRSSPTENLYVGERMIVPLRCACPTKAQSDDGVKYLLSYLISWNQFVSTISAIFGVDTGTTLAANGLSEQNFNIYPFTTLLIPLQDPPTSSQVTAPQPPPPPSITPPASVPPPSGGSSKTWIYAVLGVLGGLVLATVIGAIFFYLFFGKRKREAKSDVSSKNFESVEKPLKKEVVEDSQDFLESLSSIAQSLKLYTFEELKAATDDFSPSCRIKGSVYRGMINGDFAAIKKMNGDVSKEINLLNKINHFNLILLSGVCFNEGHWYLVYEYASNGPLSDWIRPSGERKALTWNQRLQIALDVATGLNYLHQYASPPHVHKDLNSSNILIDRDFRAKIANFGLARSAAGQEGQYVLTRHIVGTKGYMAPEYLENGLVSTKLDVYAFGILMLEILTGKEVSLLYEEVNTQLSDALTPVLCEENGQENLRKLMDPLLKGNYPPELALLVLRMIDSCLKNDPSDRPSTEDIFQSLSRISTSTVSGEWAISISDRTMPRVDAMDLPFLNAYLEAIAAPSFRTGCNFAAAGSTILPATASSVSPFSFGIQVAQFFRFKAKVQDIQSKSRKFDKYIPGQDYFQKALYMFDIGQNDLAGAFYSKTLDQILASIPTILSQFEDGFEKLYDQGARNFWIHNTGPLGCLPQNIAKFGTDTSKLDELGCVSSHIQASRLLNLQLHALCKKMQGQYPDANVTYIDIFTIKSNLIANYSRYGFEQPLMACCGYGGPPLNYDSHIACGQTKVLNGSSVTAKGCNDSTEYVNWDGIHYTEAANQYVASQILTGKYSDPPFADKMPFLLKLKF